MLRDEIWIWLFQRFSSPPLLEESVVHVASFSNQLRLSLEVKAVMSVELTTHLHLALMLWMTGGTLHGVKHSDNFSFSLSSNIYESGKNLKHL
jgi:hypothetical protein